MATGGRVTKEIETDAIPESLPAQGQAYCRQHQQESHIGKEQMEQRSSPRAKDFEKTNENECVLYKDYLPSNLKCDVFDILLLHDEQDIEEATKFQNCIQENCLISVGKVKRNPVVKKEDDITHRDNPAVTLDLGFERALFIFLFVTEAFCKKDLSLYKGYACLTDSLQENKWCVVPVLTENRGTMKRKGYKLPLMLNALHPVNYWRDLYIKEVCTLIEAKIGVHLEKKIKLKDERQQYILKNKGTLEKMRRIQESHFPVQETGDQFESSKEPGAHEEHVWYSSAGYSPGLECGPQNIDSHDGMALKSCAQSTQPEIRQESHSDLARGSADSENPSAKPAAIVSPQSRQHSGLDQMQNSQEAWSTCPSQENLPCRASPLNLKERGVTSNAEPHHDYNSEYPKTEDVSSMSENSSRAPSFSSFPDSDKGVLPKRVDFSQRPVQNFTGDSQTSNQRISTEEQRCSNMTNPSFTPGKSDAGNEIPSAHKASENAAEASGGGDVVVHIHYHHHKHCNIDSVKYMTLGDNSKIQTFGSPDSENEFDEEDNDVDDSDLQSGETEEKKPVALNPVQNEDLLYLSERLGKSWKQLGRSLGLTDSTLEQIEEDNPFSSAERNYQMLSQWVDMQARDATKATLAQHLKSGYPGELADYLLNK